MQNINGKDCLSTGEVSERLGFNVTVDFMKTLGIAPHTEHRNRCAYWLQSDMKKIARAIILHLKTNPSCT